MKMKAFYQQTKMKCYNICKKSIFEKLRKVMFKINSMLEIPNNYNVTSSNINRGEIIEESIYRNTC